MPWRPVLAIVDSTGPANVGDLFVFLGPVGTIDAAEGYSPRLAVAGPMATPKRRAHATQNDGGFG